MIDDPPLITLRRKVPRPTGAQLAELNGTPTGFIIESFEERSAESGATTSGWHKYDQSGQLLHVSESLAAR